jgi:hypothetical protein
VKYDIISVPDYPFPKHYIDKIIEILKIYDPFVILGIDDETKKYSIFNYSYSVEITENCFIAYIDRNILTYAYQFLFHESKTIKYQQLALSCFLYLNFFNSKYDLTQSVIELINTSNGYNYLVDEVFYWNYLNDLLHSSDVSYVLSFIETGNNNLPKADFSKYKQKDFSNLNVEPDIFWYSAYIHILKLACIQKKMLKSIDGLKFYFDWVIDEYKSDAACIYFSIIFFSTKNNYTIIYDDLSKIKNIAWDISHITNWFHESVDHIDKTKDIDILVTNDIKLKEIALLFSRTVNDKELSDKFILEIANKYYKKEDGIVILQMLNTFQEKLNTIHRKKRGLCNIDEKKKMIVEFESVLS